MTKNPHDSVEQAQSLILQGQELMLKGQNMLIRLASPVSATGLYGTMSEPAPKPQD